MLLVTKIHCGKDPKKAKKIMDTRVGIVIRSFHTLLLYTQRKLTTKITTKWCSNRLAETCKPWPGSLTNITLMNKQ